MTDAELFMKMRAAFRDAEAFVEAAADRIKAQAAEIERLRGDLEKLIGGAETVLEAWDSGNEASFREAIEELRADVAEEVERAVIEAFKVVFKRMEQK